MHVPRVARWVVSIAVGLVAAVATGAGPATQPSTRPQTRPVAVVTEQAKPVLARVAEAYGKLTSIELGGRVTLSVEDGGQKRVDEASFSSWYQAPNRFRHEMKDQPLLGCDGKKVYAYSERRGAYVQSDAPAGKLVFNEIPREVGRILPTQNPSLALALAKDPAAELKELASEIDLGAAQEVEGTSCVVLRLVMGGGGKGEWTLLIDPQTHRVRRAVMDLKSVLQQQGRDDIKAAVFTVDYTRIGAGVELKADRFAWGPPEGAKELAAATGEGGEAEEHEHGESEAMALIGQKAPDFTLEDLAGTKVELAKRKGSVVVLDFWASWCGPCVASLPRLDKLSGDLSKDGLKVYAINLKESKKEAADFVAANNLSLPVLLDSDGSVAKQYLVEAIPQTVIIGRDGLVKKVIVGFDPDAADELRKLVGTLLQEGKGDGGKGTPGR